MDSNKKRLGVDVPRDKEFKRDLQQIALNEGYDYPKPMLEDMVVKLVDDFRENNKE